MTASGKPCLGREAEMTACAGEPGSLGAQGLAGHERPAASMGEKIEPRAKTPARRAGEIA